jgi:N-acetylneuraminate synthase
VKFQLFRVDQLFAPEILARSAAHRARRDWELPVDFLPRLARRCQERSIAFACTPFDLEAVAQMEPHVSFFKIASYELLWHPLLRACAATGKPVVLSTGMADMNEIRAAVEVLRESGDGPFTLLHCSSAYPTPVEAANLAAIDALRREFDVAVGWSDHTRQAAVLYRAIHRYGASMVEFHLDLEGDGAEYAAGHCWLPDEMAAVIRTVRVGIAADGDGIKAPNQAEAADRAWRADPGDGLRPLMATRAVYTG